jgi:hypothetical protein
VSEILPAARPVTRLFAALPDALTCLAYCWTWLQPLRFNSDAVKTLMLVMLMEFLCVHSGGFLGATVLADDVSKMKKTLSIAGFGCFYLMFATAFSLAFHAWWPVFTFLWLLGSRFALVWLSPMPRKDEIGRQMSLWALSVAAYLAGVFLGVIFPIPELGITPQVISSLSLEGSGLWVEKPQTVIASGAFYFAVMAWSKWKYGAPI